MRHRFRGLALHLWTVDTTPLAEALGAAKAGGFDAVELRRVDFKRAEERGLSTTEVLGRVKTNGLPVSAVGCEYGWTFAAKEDRERLFASLEEACERAVTLDCATVMSGIGPGAASLDEAVSNVRRAGEIVARHGLRLALEYQFQHPIVSRLEILRELIAKSGQKSVGLLLDAWVPDQLGGTGQAIPIELLAGFRPRLPWWLAGGISPERVKPILEHIRPDGLDASSAVECAPGDKILSRVAELVAAVGTWRQD